MGKSGATTVTPDNKKPPVTSISSTFRKATARYSAWKDKDELLDVLYWGRQILALLIGVFWGLVPLKGLIALLIYVAATTLIGHFYVTSYQNQDLENLGGFWELAKEGFGAAFATFMISWITVYSAIYFNSES